MARPRARSRDVGVERGSSWRRWTALVTAVALVVPLVPSPASSAPLGAPSIRASQSAAGVQIDIKADAPEISADGRYVLFQTASEVVGFSPNDFNSAADVFVHDRYRGATTRVSNAPGGVAPSAASTEGTISADGRYVAFRTAAPLLAGAGAGAIGLADVYLVDRTTGLAELISVNSDEAVADNESTTPAISADGRFVAFASSATNLVVGDGNLARDIFVRDRTLGTTERLAISAAAVDGITPATIAISADGRYVTFDTSTAVVAGDLNGITDVYRYDRTDDVVARVSVSTTGVEGNNRSIRPEISGDGNLVLFTSQAGNMLDAGADSNGTWDVFVRDMTASTTTRISLSDAGAQLPNGATDGEFASDGRFATFSTTSPVISDDTSIVSDVALIDLVSGDVQQVSRTPTGAMPALASTQSAVPRHGHHVAFLTSASDIVTPDTNAVDDVVVRGSLVPSFTDVAPTHTFYGPITWLADAAIASGYPNGSFGATASVTRQAMAAFLFRYAKPDGWVPPVLPPFTDVPTWHPFYEEITWMAAEGIAAGYPDGTFKPSAPITRQAMAAFLARLAEADVATPCSVAPFTDVPTNHTFCEEISWLTTSGIASGYPDGTFKPGAAISRQAFASFLAKYDVIVI